MLNHIDRLPGRVFAAAMMAALALGAAGCRPADDAVDAMADAVHTAPPDTAAQASDAGSSAADQPQNTEAAQPIEPLTAEQRAVYIGRYDLGPATLEVFEEDGRLRVRGTGPTVTLVWRGSDTFVVNVDGSVRLVFEVVDGRAEHVTVHDTGGRFSGPRVQ
jgi:hypothetical protein